MNDLHPDAPRLAIAASEHLNRLFTGVVVIVLVFVDLLLWNVFLDWLGHPYRDLPLVLIPMTVVAYLIGSFVRVTSSDHGTA